MLGEKIDRRGDFVMVPNPYATLSVLVAGIRS